MKENLKLGGILLIITAIAGLLLGAAHSITKEPIAKQEQMTKNLAMKEILPEAEEFKVKDIALEGIVQEVNEGIASGKTAGYAIKVAPKGYGGAIQLMVGISTDGKIKGIKILSHSETPGLGANAPQPKFSNQFKNKPIDKVLQVVKQTPSSDNQIEAITGATITSKAVTSGVNEAVNFYNTKLKGAAK
ncbi:RnfABCDGE type electron transport complex subunit G [Clostridium sp. SYSU_GA19001]|uniref:RnfABCDGE type electron transport complex subunit G n=1 Tax=Clostridium caldaquaticum TaxID=2940653 RepID=UPI00207733EB|nr:RnfABCDGE type electron transport complex subunit G [Clostridium caldaquaticum]MCM8709825.1 RnfABCDGE type electron transport complex subunit G [Clostridium caldaquaticum]